ncbi:MAG: patatin-like phospholipase family protein [Romboutsia sp.]
MKIGLCLSGGGAKGSYQAGVIKALYDRGINEFYSISGTSIGAINGYYLFTDNVENLEKMWINIQKNSENDIKIVNNTVDNSIIIDRLKELNNNNKVKTNLYINYIEIKDRNLLEKVVNISKLDKSEGLEIIKYSSLLPINPIGTLDFKSQFGNDLIKGLYDGYKLDGGLLNNTLINPLIEDNVDKIILISTRHDYVLPDSIKDIYNEDNIIVIRPKTIFGENDTLKFEQEFCKNLYYEGYDIGKSLELNI